MSKRDEILRATAEAARILANYPAGRRTSFDIIGFVTDQGIPLLFRPLDQLWGAYVRLGTRRGILVTTKLGLAIQRFTLAHELGHHVLGHGSSMDLTLGFQGRINNGHRAAAEAAADTFAAELLASKHLMLNSAKRKGWNREALHDPNNIYQLALRLGISYEAACWGLVASDVVTRRTAETLLDKPVKECKLALAPSDLISNSWADVWKLDRADSSTHIEAAPDDLFAVHVQDHASAGYLWRVVDASPHAEIVAERGVDVKDVYGLPTSRVIFVRFRSGGCHQLLFEHTRPWNETTVDRIEIEIDGHGKEQEGLARRAKISSLGG
ncbi:MAG: ImmA/IrrE family metallo-endopeptidase [Gammaproteobacteria bacterium]|nr:ImmA/IrrE family metallo-endopeptidase [Gammaproteobacteria bacterium]